MKSLEEMGIRKIDMWPLTQYFASMEIRLHAIDCRRFEYRLKLIALACLAGLAYWVIVRILGVQITSITAWLFAIFLFVAGGLRMKRGYERRMRQLQLEYHSEIADPLYQRAFQIAASKDAFTAHCEYYQKWHETCLANGNLPDKRNVSRYEEFLRRSFKVIWQAYANFEQARARRELDASLDNRNQLANLIVILNKPLSDPIVELTDDVDSGELLQVDLALEGVHREVADI